MGESEKVINEKTKKFLDDIQFIDEKDVQKLNFFEACLYLEKLNVLDNVTKDTGDYNE